MPTYLLARCQPNCIREFRSAAEERFEDGLKAEKEDRRTAAIYLWGYTAEMTLKAAYFAATGFAEARPIAMSDLRDAVTVGLASAVYWPRQGQLHNVRAWAELLVSLRVNTSGLTYPDPGFGNKVADMGRRLEPLWSEQLRYHKNVAYPFEVRRVREAAGWLLFNSSSL
jgi:hypothetical protein